MTIKFYLSPPKKNGKSLIRCFVREYNSQLAINTGEYIKPELWDETVCRANPRKTRDKILKGSLKSLNRYLDSFEGKINEVVRSVRSKDRTAGFSVVADEIKKQFDKRENSLSSIFDEFLIVKKTKVGKASLQKFRRIKFLLETYRREKRTRLTIENISTKLFLDKFFSYLVDDKKQLNNTAYKNIQFLRTFLNWAVENGYTTNTNYKAFKTKTESNDVVYLNEKELSKLSEIQLDNERLERVRDVFLFQCLTGVRYSDIQKISREELYGSMWKLVTKKTHQPLEIPLNSIALMILEKYKDYPQPLPVISNQRMNSYLKELCKIAGIDETVKTVKFKGTERIETIHKKYELIGTHTARRTFVSLSLRKGMPTAVIMSITGHKTLRMMQNYLKVSPDHKREEMEKAWGTALRKVK